jgi:ubiquinone/menaquinone biosynthesis C-methylase UbiE
MQTVELLRRSTGKVVALDVLPQMIERARANAESAGFSSRLETIVADMKEMAFPASSFDVIWSEGAIYNMGFEAGLRKFREMLKPGGYVAVSEAVWLKPHPPSEVAEFWQEYPEIDMIDAKLEVIGRCGYQVLGHFLFPKSAWTDEYYGPMEELVTQKAKDWKGISDAEAVLCEAINEISVFRNYSDYFNYAFFVLAK